MASSRQWRQRGLAWLEAGLRIPANYKSLGLFVKFGGVLCGMGARAETLTVVF